MAKDQTDFVAKLRVKLANCQEEAPAGRALIIAVFDQRVAGVRRTFDVVSGLDGQQELVEPVVQSGFWGIGRHHYRMHAPCEMSLEKAWHASDSC
jgi:hypothetical protein